MTKKTEPARQLMLEETSILAPILLITPNPYQPASRHEFAPEDIEKMAISILEHGLLQLPVVRVRKLEHADFPERHVYEMGDGWLRLCGYRYLAQEKKLKGYNAIPVMVRNLTDRQMADLVMEANTVRKDLSPIDLAKLYRRYLYDFKVTQEELARLHNVSQGEIANTIRLLDLPEDIQQKIISHDISETHGRYLLRLNSLPKEQAKLIAAVREDKLPVSRLDYEVKKTLWEKTQPLCEEQYDSTKPKFDLAACEKCEHRELMKSPWRDTEEAKPRCRDAKCWNEKQKLVLTALRKSELEKLAKEGITQVFLAKELPYNKFATIYDPAPAECKSCAKRGARESEYSDLEQFTIVCLDKACAQKKEKTKRDTEVATRAEKEQKVEQEINEVFQAEPGENIALATIACLLVANQFAYSEQPILDKLTALFNLAQKGDKQKATAKSVLAGLRKLEEEVLFYQVLPRLAFEMFRIRAGNSAQIASILNLFRGDGKKPKSPRPIKESVKESKLVPGSPELPCDTCANNPTCDRSHFYVDENGKDVCEVKIDLVHPAQLDALFPDLDKLVIRTSQEEGKFHSFKLGDIEVHGKTLIGCTVALAKRLALTSSDKPKDVALALKDLPATRNRDLLVGFLEGKEGVDV